MRAVAVEAADLRGGIRIEWMTVAWMVLEGGVSLLAAAAAHSVALLAFGADSLIELVSAAVLLRRLAVESAGASTAVVARAERTASAVVSGLLLALALYVVGTSAHALLAHARPDVSLPGLAMAGASVVVMPWLVVVKRRVAARVGSAALRADAACGVTCAYMAATLLIGLGLRAVLGWWWADPVAALGIVYFLVREGLEALDAARGKACTCCAHGD